MDNNERIAVALERIANHLDFFAEFVKKEMDEEDGMDGTSRLDKITMGINVYIDLYDYIKDRFKSYGRVALGYVIDFINTEMHTTIDIAAKDFKLGWNSIKDMKFTIKDDNVILDLTNVKEFV